MNALATRGVPGLISMRQIIDLAARHFGVTPADIVSTRRERSILEARHAAMYAVREILPRSYPEIARAFGDRDHTSIIHAVRQVTQRMLLDHAYRTEIEAFIASCRAERPAGPADGDPFKAAARIMQQPTLATNASVETIRDFAAIVSAALTEASLQDAEAEAEANARAAEVESLRERLAAIEPEIISFVHAFWVLGRSSERGRLRAQEALERRAEALVEKAAPLFKIERT